jgi:ABC-type multidrug transport system fused ATPase/permease subunit
MLRTILSAYFTRKILRFLSFRCALVTEELVAKVLNQSLARIQGTTTQELLYTVTSGVNVIVMGILGSSAALISDLSLLIIMTSGLFIVEPTLAIASLIFFGGIGLLLYKLMHYRAHTLGYRDSLLNIQSNEKISEVILSYREVLVRNRLGYYSKEIGELRQKLAATQSELAFMPNVSKYVIETAMILSAVLVSAWLFSTQDANKAIATLTIFMATGARIVPAVLRLQQGSLQLKGSAGSGKKTLLLVNELTNLSAVHPVVPAFSVNHQDFLGGVKLKDMSFSYGGDAQFTIGQISLSVNHGSMVSIVGPSGAGKSTVVDLLLGVLVPSSGEVKIFGVSPRQAIQRWPGAIAYVPQDIQVFSGTIKENLLLGFSDHEVNESVCWDALRIAQLSDFVGELPEGLESQVGDRGTSLSGGQRQRLGIARALITKPKLIVLDEATSALDGETELNIGNALNQLKNDVTIIMIAHRLSTVRNSDVVVYMDRGKILSMGTFDHVRNNVPNFDRQASLLGL